MGGTVHGTGRVLSLENGTVGEGSSEVLGDGTVGTTIGTGTGAVDTRGSAGTGGSVGWLRGIICVGGGTVEIEGWTETGGIVGWVRGVTCVGGTGVCNISVSIVSKFCSVREVRWSACASFRTAFRVASPACSVGIIGFGGWVSMVMRSRIFCWMKSSIFTCGNLNCLGMKVTVSASTSTRVSANTHFTHR